MVLLYINYYLSIFGSCKGAVVNRLYTPEEYFCWVDYEQLKKNREEGSCTGID